jgi:hypothetical protein
LGLCGLRNGVGAAYQGAYTGGGEQLQEQADSIASHDRVPVEVLAFLTWPWTNIVLYLNVKGGHPVCSFCTGMAWGSVVGRLGPFVLLRPNHEDGSRG